MSKNQKNLWTLEEERLLMSLIRANCTYHLAAIKLGKSISACESKFLQIQGRFRPKLTIEEIQGMDFLIESQKQMAISLFETNPFYAHNYIKNIERYRNSKCQEVENAQR